MENKKKNYPSRMSLILRIAMSAYLLYLAWGLKEAPAKYTGIQHWIFIAAMILFTAVGIVLGGFSLKAYMNGDYAEAQEEDDQEES